MAAKPPQQAAPASAASLANAAINVAALRENGKRDLIDCLQSLRGSKALVLDPTISGPLGLITEKSVLKEQGVERTYHLGPTPLETDQTQVIYIVRAKLQLMKMIANHVKAHRAAKQSKEYRIFLVPRNSLMCQRALEEEGVAQFVVVDEYPLDLIPFDDDVLSLEMGDSFKECFVDGDRTSLFHVAKSIMKLQCLFGIIPNIKGKGHAAKAVCDMMLRMRRELGQDEPAVDPEIDQIIIIDREVDLITPMLTQLTYEGLLDDIYTIKNGMVDLDPKLTGAAPPPGGGPARPTKVALNSQDRLYSELRDLNFTAVGPALKRRALSLQEVEQERHKLGDSAVSQIKDYVKKLKDMNIQQEKNLLGLHTNVASEIGAAVRDGDFNRRLESEQSLLQGREGKVSDFIEECIYKQDPLTRTLRMLCLHSLTTSGLKKHDFYRRELMQSYGYDSLFTLNNLEKVGLMRKQEGRSYWSNLKKSLNLLVEDIDETNPNDIAYVFSGYAPLSVRLVQAATKVGGNWRGLEEPLRCLPGPLFEEAQAPPAALRRGGGDAGRAQGNRPKVTLVYFVGGVTYSELSAIRFLNKQEEGQRDYIVATTKLINGDSLLASMVEKVPSGLEPPLPSLSGAGGRR